MSRSVVSQGEISVNKNRADSYQRHKGFIVFCETNLRYEKGFKAWIFLGPYLLGALGLETMITEHTKTATALGPWLGFLAYLILFPLAWRRILKLVALKKATPVVPLR
ncbi:MAG: hypothetical protein LV479_03320 [Methylacidiphilales bacterium]|nr:hypothetical protein [Candidatus Methylacidiphilales bacterium]